MQRDVERDNRRYLEQQIENLRQTVHDQQTIIAQQLIFRQQANTLATQVRDLQSQMESMSIVQTTVEEFTDRAGLPDRGDVNQRGQPIMATVTSYDLSECGKDPDHPEYGVTASGVYVKENHTAAGAPMFPFGTEIYIPAMGTTYTIEDRGGMVVDKDPTYGLPCIDIYMIAHADVEAFGGKALDVYVIKWGEGNE